jgi:uncharacterized membrane protein
MQLPWHLYFMAVLYVLAGINHFRVPRLYKRMIPPVLPYTKLINILSGLAEVVLGLLLCVPEYTEFAAWGIIVMLVAIFPSNVYMYLSDKAALGLPKWVRLIRLPFQLALIWWAYQYT